MDTFKLKPAVKSYIWGGTNLKKYGKCPIHRNSFIKNFVGEYE